MMVYLFCSTLNNKNHHLEINKYAKHFILTFYEAEDLLVEDNISMYPKNK